MMRSRSMVLMVLMIFTASVNLWAQSGRSTEAGERHYSLNVILQPASEDNPAWSAPNAETPPITRSQLALYEAGIEQHIENFRADPTGARLVLVVDNSQNLHAETKDMETAARALIKELYVGDQAMFVAYNQAPEVLEDFTDDAKKLVEAAKLFHKKAAPRLYDALAAVVEDALRKEVGISKRVIILLSDGYDNGSQYEYDRILSVLQTENIVVYGLQVPDRTFGAPRNRKLGPKPPEAFRGLVEGTGGRIFKIEDSAQAMKVITEEVRTRWYTLTYTPKGINTVIARRLLVSLSDDKYVMRTKKQQPASN